MDLVYVKTLYSNPTTVSSKPIMVRSKPITVRSKPTKRKSIKTGKFEVYTDKAGEYRFRLKAPNGEIIAIGEGYKTKKSCINGIQSVKKNVLKPKIVELK
jgi:uncharacterized protein YegP (UPF0339 family)